MKQGDRNKRTVPGFLPECFVRDALPGKFLSAVCALRDHGMAALCSAGSGLTCFLPGHGIAVGTWSAPPLPPQIPGCSYCSE